MNSVLVILLLVCDRQGPSLGIRPRGSLPGAYLLTFFVNSVAGKGFEVSRPALYFHAFLRFMVAGIDTVIK